MFRGHFWQSYSFSLDIVVLAWKYDHQPGQSVLEILASAGLYRAREKAPPFVCQISIMGNMSACFSVHTLTSIMPKTSKRSILLPWRPILRGILDRGVMDCWWLLPRQQADATIRLALFKQHGEVWHFVWNKSTWQRRAFVRGDEYRAWKVFALLLLLPLYIVACDSRKENLCVGLLRARLFTCCGERKFQVEYRARRALKNRVR